MRVACSAVFWGLIQLNTAKPIQCAIQNTSQYIPIHPNTSRYKIHPDTSPYSETCVSRLYARGLTSCARPPWMDVPSFLKQLDLEAFETAFNVCGYDSVDTLRELTPEDFITLVKDTGMKSGHAVKLRCALALPPAAAKPAAEPKAAAEGAGSLLAALHLDPDLRRSGPLLRSARGATALPTATANAAGGAMLYGSARAVSTYTAELQYSEPYRKSGPHTAIHQRRIVPP